MDKPRGAIQYPYIEVCWDNYEGNTVEGFWGSAARRESFTGVDSLQQYFICDDSCQLFDTRDFSTRWFFFVVR
jgi:hypothetical protein